MIGTRAFLVNRRLFLHLHHHIRRKFNVRYIHSTIIPQCASPATLVSYDIQPISGKFHYTSDLQSIIIQFTSSPVIRAITSDVGGELDIDWLNSAECTNEELIERLLFVGNYCLHKNVVLTSTTFDTVVDNFCQKLPNFNENEIIASLQVFAKMPISEFTLNDRNFTELFMALDDHCGFCIRNWNCDQLLTIWDIWVTIPHMKASKFIKTVGRRFLQFTHGMTPQQYVQCMDNLAKLRRFVDEKTPFMKHFEQKIDELSAEEVGIVCGVLDLNDSGRLTKLDLVENIMNKIIAEDNLDAVSNKSLYNSLSVVEDSMRRELKCKATELMDKLTHQIKLRTNRVNHIICNLGAKNAVFNDGCIKALLQFALENIDKFTLIDMEKTALTMCRYYPSSERQLVLQVFRKFIDEIPKRTTEIAESPKRIVTLLYYLSAFGIHNENLIHNVLRDDFLRAVYLHNKFYPAELYGIDAYARINLKDTYNGKTLKGKAKIMSWVPVKDGPYKLHGPEAVSVQIADTIEHLGIPYCYSHALPHTETADIFMVFDKDKRDFIDYRNEFPKLYNGLIMWKNQLTKSSSNLEVIAVVSSYFKNYDYESNKPNALHQYKLNQLTLLDYKWIAVCYNEWNTLTPEQRKTYFEKKLNEILATI